MNIPDDGGPAFPMQDQSAIHAWAQARIEMLRLETTAERDAAYIQARAEAIGGMSLRDYFAAKAMQSFLAGHVSHCGHESHWPYDSMAGDAYQVADAMLKARKEGGAS